MVVPLHLYADFSSGDTWYCKKKNHMGSKKASQITIDQINVCETVETFKMVHNKIFLFHIFKSWTFGLGKEKDQKMSLF